MLQKSGTLRDLLLKVAALAEVPVNELVATDYYGHTFWKVYHETDSTGNIGSNDQVVRYESTAGLLGVLKMGLVQAVLPSRLEADSPAGWGCWQPIIAAVVLLRRMTDLPAL